MGVGTTDISVVQAQSLQVEIYDQYLNGVGTDSWLSWNSPAGEYVQVVARNADCIGATPMFTVYQMAARGEGNLEVLRDWAFMKDYWNTLRVLYQQIAKYGKPVLVNLEPDLWGYTQRVSRTEPTLQFAQVYDAAAPLNDDCVGLGNDVAGLAQCMVRMARKYAPNAYIGFPPSLFGDNEPTELAYFKAIGADKADFVVMQTLDRDIGCVEAQYTANQANCARPANAFNLKIWDETNTTSPNFREHFALARSYHDSLGLPILWWQTPLGVASATAGGSANQFRDNRVRYFMTHASELVAAGGVGVVFGQGHTSQTTLTTDGGQFRNYLTQYRASPAALP